MHDWIGELRVTREEKPFPHIIIKNFLKEEHARAVSRALAQQEFSRKEADLFSFSQTADLYTAKNKTIQEFLRLLQDKEFTRHINTLSGVQTTAGRVDAAGFLYTDTDYLLCHDDGISTRRIAYIYNLSEKFTAKDGGALCLYSTKNHRPEKVVKRLIPAWNTLVLFTVSKNSHHKVEELLSAKKRYSITGWFHA